MIQRLDEFRGSTREVRPGRETCHGFGLAGGFTFRFGFNDGFFAFGGSGCHGAELIGNWKYR